jgi:hypothetical protein
LDAHSLLGFLPEEGMIGRIIKLSPAMCRARLAHLCRLLVISCGDSGHALCDDSCPLALRSPGRQHRHLIELLRAKCHPAP